MSLQNTATVNQFAHNCSILWREWLKENVLAREKRLKNAIVSCTTFMAPLNISLPYPDLNGNCGQFCWGEWLLELDNSYTTDNDITYEEFVELCASAYHESRHAEQFYRIAQGLASSALSFPDMSSAQVINDFSKTGMGGGVQAKIAAFEGRAMRQNNAATARMIAKWLSIPQEKAMHALLSSGAFATYIALPKPAWYKRNTALLEVEEWMRSTYKRTLGNINRWAQSDHGPYKIYRDLPEEHDAHEIEKLVEAALKNRIGHNYILNKDQPRSNTGLFGN